MKEVAAKALSILAALFGFLGVIGPPVSTETLRDVPWFGPFVGWLTWNRLPWTFAFWSLAVASFWAARRVSEEGD